MRQLHLRFRMPASENHEELLEMKLLPSVRYVHHLIRLPVFQSMLQRGQIRGRIIESAIAFLDESRMILELGNLLKKNSQRPFTRPRNSSLEQLRHQGRQTRII